MTDERWPSEADGQPEEAPEVTKEVEEGTSVPGDGTPEREPTPAEIRKYKLGEEEFDEPTLLKIVGDYRNDTKWKAANDRRSAELKESYRTLEKARQLDEYLEAHPEKYGEVLKLLREEQEQDPDRVDISKDPVIAELKKRQEALEFKQEVKEQEALLDKEISGLQSDPKYGPLFKEKPELLQEILTYALENNLKVKTAFRDLMFEKAQTMGLEERQKREAEAKEKQNGLKVPAGTKPSGRPRKGGMDWNTAFAEADRDGKFKDM
jgi:hypothetical protein